jgi:hypothetical protein
MVVSIQIHAPVTLPPVKQPPVRHWLGRLVGPRALWTLWRRGKSCLCQESDPSHSAFHYTDWAIWLLGYTIAQAVSHWLFTAAAQVQTQVRPKGICGGQIGAGAGFLWVLQFPLPILFPTAWYSSSSTIQGWYNRPNSDWCTKWTQSHPTPRTIRLLN